MFKQVKASEIKQNPPGVYKDGVPIISVMISDQSSQGFVAWADGTFMKFGIISWSDPYRMEWRDDDLDFLDFGDDDLINSNIITSEELKEMRDKEQSGRKEASKAQRRAMWDSLKKEFGD